MTIGGVSTASLESVPTIGIAAVLTVVGGGLAAFIPPSTHPERSTEGPADRSLLAVVRAGLDSLTTGLAAVRGTVVRDVLLTEIVINVAVAPYTLLLATISDRVFAVATAYGLLLAAGRIGSLIGNALVPRLHRSRWRLYLTGIFATASVALSVAATGILVGRVSLPVMGVVLGSALVVFGAVMPLFNVPGDSLVQAAVGDDVRGRVVTLTNASVQLGFPIGYLGAGWLVDRV